MAVALGSCVACSDPEPAPPTPAEASPASAPESPPISEAGRWREFRTQRFDDALSDEQRAMIEQLEQIGYVTGSQEAADATGVTRHDPGRAFAGLNFYVSGHAP